MEITGGALPEGDLGHLSHRKCGNFLWCAPASRPQHRAIRCRERRPIRRCSQLSLLAAPPLPRAHVVGRTLEINHAPYTIVGVMPRSFAFHDTIGVGDVYLPGSLMRDVANLPNLAYIPWIKLRPHFTLAAANAALEPVVREFVHGASQELYRELASRSATHYRAFPAGNRPHADASSRRRGALADHRLRQLLHPPAGSRPHAGSMSSPSVARSAPVAGASFASCLWKAWSSRVPAPCLALLRLTGLQSFPCCFLRILFQPNRWIRINAPILAFSVALALLCGILFGLVPALRLSRHDSARMLPGRHIGVVAAPAKHPWSVLIVGQVALTLLLMATAGTAIRGFLYLMQKPLGYDPANVIKVGIMFARPTTRASGAAFSRTKRAAGYIEQIRAASHPSPVSPRGRCRHRRHAALYGHLYGH